MSSTPMRLDGRDMAVIEEIEPGEVVHLTKFQSLYRNKTDIIRPKTLERRIRHLVRGPEFEMVEFQSWQFRGLNWE